MLLRDIKNIFHNELDTHYGANEVSSFFYLLIENYFGLGRFVLAIQPDLMTTKEEESKLFFALSELKLHRPIQYIIGHTYFMDLKFRVGPEVLIPRPETEELVRWILEDNKGSAKAILDIGTGSGCIAISLAKFLDKSKVSALDISVEALEVAKENAITARVKVDFFQADILKYRPEQKFDIIVSNPPYVRELEKNEMNKNVLSFEPEGALFVSDDNPLIFYRGIANLATKNLKTNGILYLEINQYLASETCELLSEFNFESVELRKDIFGNDRMIKAIKS